MKHSQPIFFGKTIHFTLSDSEASLKLMKHDGISVDQVLRGMISVCEIRNEDLWIQSDNAPSQYKNKIPFAFLQELANEFNLRIIRTYGASCHGEGVINATSSFDAKNALRRDIVTHDVSSIKLKTSSIIL